MMKKLLSACMFAVVALSASAWNSGDYVYTKVAKYRITGTNLVTNGQFTDGTTDGWTATDEVNYPLAAVFGPAEDGGVTVQAGQTDLTAGMYQAVKIDAGGTYVVSLKAKGIAAGYTDHDLTGAGTNYINAYFNTDGALGTKDGTTLVYGENGVGGAYQFSFNADDFVEVFFAIEAPQDGNIMIDFRGMVEGLTIKDVECHTAEEVYDDRIANDRIAYFKKYTTEGNFDGKPYYDDFLASVKAVEDAIAANAAPSDMATLMDNLETDWSLFVGENFSNMLDLIPTTDGSANTGNNSANWMHWVTKWNKLSNDYNGKAPWKWTTDRWSHKTAAANSPLQIQWQRKASGDWNNIATLTATLDPGTYFWGVTGQGGMMTLDKARWARSWANENAATQLFFNGDTTEVFILNSARNTDYVFKYELTETKEITLGIICNTNSAATDGFDVQFFNPVLYKVKVDGELAPEEKAYLDAVATQLEALQGRIDVANGYLSEANDTLPWGKEDLKLGVDEAQVRYNEWAAMSEDDLLDTYWEDIQIPDTIMTHGVRFLNNNYINPFIAKNKPLTDMPGAIAAAHQLIGQRIYSSSSKMGDYAAMIAETEAMYAEKLKAPFSSADSLALIDQKAALEAMAEDFKAAIDYTVIVDIDFGTTEAPVAFEEHTTELPTEPDSEGETSTYYTIAGAKGVMTFTDITGSYPYALGWGSATDETTGVVIATDSLGMLRVGNSEAVVEFSGAPVKETDIVNIKFDFYAGNLTKSKTGYKVLTAEGDTICGLFYSPYDGNDDMNTFGIDYTKLPKVGSGSASNAAIAAASNKTQFDIVLDYGAKSMYCTTISSKGTVTSATFDLPEVAPAKFVLYSNYTNVDRRCWFDNLKVWNIAAGEVGIDNVEAIRPVDNNMYNLQGQRILAPVKGQIYIQNGKKMLAK
ncbi:MAG: hypothetical protein IKJ92_04140 [Bacteroidaceae bacterium]|nr:hypothetical protein [Bacteroidaceae bacterium]